MDWFGTGYGAVLSRTVTVIVAVAEPFATTGLPVSVTDELAADGGPVIVKLYAWVLTSPAESVAWTENVQTPPDVGVPESTPVDALKLRPYSDVHVEPVVTGFVPATSANV